MKRSRKFYVDKGALKILKTENWNEDIAEAEINSAVSAAYERHLRADLIADKLFSMGGTNYRLIQLTKEYVDQLFLSHCSCAYNEEFYDSYNDFYEEYEDITNMYLSYMLEGDHIPELFLKLQYSDEELSESVLVDIKQNVEKYNQTHRYNSEEQQAAVKEMEVLMEAEKERRLATNNWVDSWSPHICSFDGPLGNKKVMPMARTDLERLLHVPFDTYGRVYSWTWGAGIKGLLFFGRDIIQEDLVFTFYTN